MGIRGFQGTALILGVLVVAPATTADDYNHAICPLILHQEQVEREEHELAIDLAVSHLTAAESIFTLIDQLWKTDAIERMIHLNAKHIRDLAQIRVKRRRLLLKRQEAVIEQYVSVCSPPSAGESAADRRTRFDEAHRLYLQADCHRIGKNLAIAEVDLTYHNEVLTIMQDLRENGVATRQEVILAERDVELTRKQVEHQGRRVRACVNSGAAGGDGAR